MRNMRSNSTLLVSFVKLNRE